MRIDHAARHRHRRVSALGASVMALAVLTGISLAVSAAKEATLQRHCGPAASQGKVLAQTLNACLREQQRKTR